MLQPFLSFLDVSRSFAGRMRDELAVRRAVPRLVVDVSERLEGVREAGDRAPSVLLNEKPQVRSRR
jgi:hypothetical protein